MPPGVRVKVDITLHNNTSSFMSDSQQNQSRREGMAME